MKKCAIITSYIEESLSFYVDKIKDSFIICADGGYDHAKSVELIPDLVIGDFDSAEQKVDDNVQIITYASEKNDTDTGLCIQKAIEMGFEDLLIIGGIGGRFDHTIANIQSMSAAADFVQKISICDKNNFATILKNNQIQLEKKPDAFLSLFALSDVCSGVSVSGVKYPLNNHTLTNTFPLGVSNEFVEDRAEVKVDHGTLLVLLSS